MLLTKVISLTACLAVLLSAMNSAAVEAQSSDQKTDVPPMKNKTDMKVKLQAAGVKLNQLYQAAHVTTSSTPPSDFPVPVYPGAASMVFIAQKDLRGASIHTSDAPPTVCNWYKQSLTQAGWALDPSSGNLKSGVCFVRATKDGQQVTISSSHPAKNPLTGISINVVKVPAVFQTK